MIIINSVDTNIIVGVSIKHDPWNFYAKRVFSKYENLFYTNTVKEESLKKINYLVKNYTAFLEEVKNRIEKDFITKKEFIELFESIDSIVYGSVPFNQKNLAEHIWDIGGWFLDVDQNEITNTLDTIMESLYVDSFKTYTKYCNMLILHTRSLEYVELLKKVRSCKSSDLSVHMHSPDDYIILDIHDLGIKEKTKVNLITSDLGLVKLKKCLINLTEINDIVFIKDIYN